MKDDGFDLWMRAEGFLTPANDYGDRAFCYPENGFERNKTIEPEIKKENKFISNLKVYFTNLVNSLKSMKTITKFKVNREKSKAFIIASNDESYGYFKNEFGDCIDYNNSLIVPDHEFEQQRSR